MTDRNPDDLYDALRDRLADYGQEPPAALWTGIRAQLPRPVAPPQLRKRRRRAPVAWLFLVTLTVAAVGAGWHWWEAKKATTIVSKVGQIDSRIPTPNAARTSPTNTQNPGTAGSATPQEPALSTPAAARVASATTQQRLTTDASAKSVGTSVAAPAASAGWAAANGSQRATAPALDATSAPAGAAGSASTKAIVAASVAEAASAGATGRTAENPRNLVAKNLTANTIYDKKHSILAARGQAQELGKQTIAVASNTSRSPETTKPAMAKSGAGRPGRNSSIASIAQSSQALAATRRLPTRHHQTTAALAAVATPAAGQSRPQSQSSTPPNTDQPTRQSALTSAAVSAAPLVANRLTQPPTEAAKPARIIAVQLAAGPGLPTPQPVAVVPSPLPLPFAARWAVQVVTGPALTYRHLYTASGLSYATLPAPIATLNSITTPVATLERPALGSAAQLTGRRTLGAHWSLSAGLGYAEYASALALQQVHAATPRVIANSPISDSAGIHRRDTYRFVTVPVRIGYGWTLSGRWRVGLLAGAEAAVYVGGSSTEGSACACQSQTWTFAANPYRRVSVGASLGAEVRYRLGEGGRWELLAQPTATYLLTSLAPSTSAYYQRHLLGATALLGAAFNLP